MSRSADVRSLYIEGENINKIVKTIAKFPKVENTFISYLNMPGLPITSQIRVYDVYGHIWNLP